MSAHDITIIGSYTSGINAIQIEAENGKVYELNGRHVKKPSKGIYIINGKKVVVKSLYIINNVRSTPQGVLLF